MRLLATVLLSAAALCRAAEPAEGRWEGSVQIPGRELSVQIDLARDGSGKWTGSVVVPGTNVKGAPLSDIVVTGAEVSFALKGAIGDPVFHGKIGANGLAGEFREAGNTAPFALHNTGAAQVELPRRSTAVSAELAREWQGDLPLNGNILKATLRLTNHADSAATADFKVVGKRETVLPVDWVSQDGEWLTIRASEYGMAFEGRFDASTKELTGVFIQGPKETPLVLRPAKP